MKIVPVQKHVRSIRGSKEQALKELLDQGVIPQIAETAVKLATARFAVKSYVWAMKSSKIVYQKLQGSRLAHSSNVAFYLLQGVWEHIIRDAKVNSALSDEQWCYNHDLVLKEFGLRLPKGSRKDVIKVLKGAMALLYCTL